jgi:hypothetical protein
VDFSFSPDCLQQEHFHSTVDIEPENYQPSSTDSFSQDDYDFLSCLIEEKKVKRKRRPQKKYPHPMKYVDGPGPTNKDVLFGRGERSNEHAGNKEYLKKVKRHKKLYRSATTNQEKRTIVNDIIKAIHDGKGRFLEKTRSGVQVMVYSSSRRGVHESASSLLEPEISRRRRKATRYHHHETLNAKHDSTFDMGSMYICKYMF